MNNIEINTVNNIDNISYIPSGVCCKCINLKIENNIVKDAEFIGGCNGNLQGIRSLILGQNIDEISQKLYGICCGVKTTSCPDQLAKAIQAYKLEKSNSLTAIS